MKKKVIPLFTAAIVLLSGCDHSSDSSPYTEEATSDYSCETENSLSEESDNAAAGIAVGSPEDNSEETENEGVSLLKSEYDYLREMIDFSGEYVKLDELGYEYYTFSYADLGNVLPYSFSSADDELLYFCCSETDSYDYYTGILTLYEYNVRTRETNEVFSITWQYMNGYCYADKDYIVYTNNETGYLLIRESGDIVTLPMWDCRASLYRCGNSFFYCINEDFTNSDGSFSLKESVICRYNPTDNSFKKMWADSCIIGTYNDKLLITYEDNYSNFVYIADEAGDVTALYCSPEDIQALGGKIGYETAFDSSAVFGDRYEVGMITPTGDGLYGKRTFFKTYYGTSVYGVRISEQNAMTVNLDKNFEYTTLLIDIDSRKAAVIDNDNNVYMNNLCSGNWLYFDNPEEQTIIAVNTLRQ